MYINPIIESKKTHLTEQDIVSIYNESKAGKSDELLSIKYRVTKDTVSNIRRLKGGYAKYFQNETPTFREQKLVSDEKAYDIYKQCSSATATLKEIAEVNGISMNTIYDIKFLRNGYKHLREKYNIAPYQETRNVENLRDYEKFDNIKYALENGLTAKEIMDEYGYSKTNVYKIKAIIENGDPY